MASEVNDGYSVAQADNRRDGSSFNKFKFVGTNHQVPLLADDSEGTGSGVCVHQRRRGGLSPRDRGPGDLHRWGYREGNRRCEEVIL